MLWKNDFKRLWNVVKAKEDCIVSGKRDGTEGSLIKWQAGLKKQCEVRHDEEFV